MSASCEVSLSIERTYVCRRLRHANPDRRHPLRLLAVAAWAANPSLATAACAAGIDRSGGIEQQTGRRPARPLPQDPGHRPRAADNEPPRTSDPIVPTRRRAAQGPAQGFAVESSTRATRPAGCCARNMAAICSWRKAIRPDPGAAPIAVPARSADLESSPTSFAAIGIAFSPRGPGAQYLYVAESWIIRFPYRSGQMTATSPPRSLPACPSVLANCRDKAIGPVTSRSTSAPDPLRLDRSFFQLRGMARTRPVVPQIIDPWIPLGGKAANRTAHRHSQPRVDPRDIAGGRARYGPSDE